MPKSLPPEEKSGILFPNDRKEKETQPDMRGRLMLQGKEYWVSAWRKSSKAGNPYMTLALTEVDFRPERERHEDRQAPAAPAGGDAPPLDDDLPF